MDHFSPARKVIILIAATVFSFAGAIYSSALGDGALWAELIVALAAILLPLFASFFLYRGRLAKVVFVIVIVAALSNLVLGADLSAVHSTFKHLCETYGYKLNSTNDNFYTCGDPSGAPGFRTNVFSGSLLGSVAYGLFLLTIFFGFINPFIMLGYWLKNHKK